MVHKIVELPNRTVENVGSAIRISDWITQPPTNIPLLMHVS